MKKVLIIVLAAIGLASFTSFIAGGYAITGTIAGLPDGTKVTLERQDEAKGIIVVDSAKVLGGKFSFKGTTPEPSIHFLQVDKIQGKVAFILEEGKISLTLYKDSISKSRISGTKNNEDLQGFNVAAMKVQKKMQDFQAVNMTKMQDAQAKQDTVVINQLMKDFGKFQEEMMTLSSAFPEKNPKSFISVLFVDNMFNSPEVNIDKIKKAYNALDMSVRNTAPGKKLKVRIEAYRSLANGSAAPEFSAPNPQGKTVSLKESLGKITIVDFWASWCGPCRKENPNVVALYNDFHSKGLNVIGVSLDKDGGKWKEAIAKDGLTWTHVSNLMFWQDPIAEQYNVKSIPATFILDAKGNIIGRDLRGEELRAFVVNALK